VYRGKREFLEKTSTRGERLRKRGGRGGGLPQRDCKDTKSGKHHFSEDFGKRGKLSVSSQANRQMSDGCNEDLEKGDTE